MHEIRCKSNFLLVYIFSGNFNNERIIMIGMIIDVIILFGTIAHRLSSLIRGGFKVYSRIYSDQDVR